MGRWFKKGRVLGIKVGRDLRPIIVPVLAVALAPVIGPAVVSLLPATVPAAVATTLTTAVASGTATLVTGGNETEILQAASIGAIASVVHAVVPVVTPVLAPPIVSVSLESAATAVLTGQDVAKSVLNTGPIPSAVKSIIQGEVKTVIKESLLSGATGFACELARDFGEEVAAKVYTPQIPISSCQDKDTPEETCPTIIKDRKETKENKEIKEETPEPFEAKFGKLAPRIPQTFSLSLLFRIHKLRWW